MLIRFLHWVAKDVLPGRAWECWLRWRYQCESRPSRAGRDAAACADVRRQLHTIFTVPRRNIFDTPASTRRPVEVERDCGCPVARTGSGVYVRQVHDSTCEHVEYKRGGVIRVDRQLIPHSSWAKDCGCASCYEKRRPTAEYLLLQPKNASEPC